MHNFHFGIVKLVEGGDKIKFYRLPTQIVHLDPKTPKKIFKIFLTPLDTPSEGCNLAMFEKRSENLDGLELE